MKIALLGDGKTGAKVLEIAGKDNVVIFNHANKPTLGKVKDCDVVISFIPGPAFIDYIDLLIEAKIPVATGSTGFTWPKDVDSKLKQNNIAWVTASNFALGMNLVHAMINVLSKTPKLFKEYNFKIHELHHINKTDMPSGTALSWREWLGVDAEITADREGDTIGFHQLKLSTPFEDITLEHLSKDRKIFAQGAIWTAEKLVSGDIEPGLHNLQDIMKNELNL